MPAAALTTLRVFVSSCLRVVTQNTAKHPETRASEEANRNRSDKRDSGSPRQPSRPFVSSCLRVITQNTAKHPETRAATSEEPEERKQREEARGCVA